MRHSTDAKHDSPIGSPRPNAGEGLGVRGIVAPSINSSHSLQRLEAGKSGGRAAARPYLDQFSVAWPRQL